MGVGWLLLLLITEGAQAESELVVQTDRPVIVVVNMRPYPTDGGTRHIPFVRAQAGVQKVRIRNLLGEQQWMGSVDLADGHEVTLLWADKGMTVGQPKPLAGADADSVGAIVPQPLVVIEPQLGSEHGVGSEPPVGPAVQLASPEPASTGASSARVDPFVAAATEGSVSGRGSAEPPTSEVVEPVGVGLGEVQFRNRTETWTNIVVDGQLHEVRGQPVVTLALPGGLHQVAFRDFQDRGSWWAGRVMVRAGDVVEVQFSKASAPASPRDPGAWQAGP